MATKLHVVTGDQYRAIDRRIREVKRQLDQDGGSPLDPDAVADTLQEIVEGCFSGRGELLKPVSGGEHLVIEPTDGSQVLAEASNTFAYIDPDFRNWNADEPGPATQQAQVRVYEMAENATFVQMFGSLAPDVDKLCLTQAQINQFVVKHRDQLRSDGYATFFLFKSHDHFFVANVIVSSVRLEVDVYRFVHSLVWYAEGRRRVVVPQLA